MAWFEGSIKCSNQTNKQTKPFEVKCGVSVFKSQKRTVVSPEPLAKYLKKKMGELKKVRSYKVVDR